MAKNNLRDKLDGDELDLSMMSLTEVPVKDIVSEGKFKRACFGIYCYRSHLKAYQIVKVKSQCIKKKKNSRYFLQRFPSDFRPG